jgi:hypothetical protein
MHEHPTPPSERTTKPPRSSPIKVAPVVLYEAQGHGAPAVYDRLVRAGFTVHREPRFRDAAPWLVRDPDAVLVLVVPPTQSSRRSVLEALRRLRPRTAIVAIVAETTAEAVADLERAGVVRLLTSDTAALEIVDTLVALAERGASRPSMPPPSLAPDSQPPIIRWS